MVIGPLLLGRRKTSHGIMALVRRAVSDGRMFLELIRAQSCTIATRGAELLRRAKENLSVLPRMVMSACASQCLANMRSLVEGRRTPDLVDLADLTSSTGRMSSQWRSFSACSGAGEALSGGRNAASGRSGASAFALWSAVLRCLPMLKPA